MNKNRISIMYSLWLTSTFWSQTIISNYIANSPPITPRRLQDNGKAVGWLSLPGDNEVRPGLWPQTAVCSWADCSLC